MIVCYSLLGLGTRRRVVGKSKDPPEREEKEKSKKIVF
jgi:hypothetical protein